MRKKTNSINGFTLIELLVVVSILSILMALALPNFSDTIEAQASNAEFKRIRTMLNLARSEAIKRGRDVSICASDDGLDCDLNNWSNGYILFVDNNGDANGAAGTIDAGDEVIRAYNAAGSSSTITMTVPMLTYNSLGFSGTGGTQTFKICPSSNNANNARSLEVGPSGRGRLIETGIVCP